MIITYLFPDVSARQLIIRPSGGFLFLGSFSSSINYIVYEGELSQSMERTMALGELAVDTGCLSADHCFHICLVYGVERLEGYN